jgi:hypothetical protein
VYGTHRKTDRVLYLTIYAVQHLRGSGRLTYVLHKNNPEKQDAIETSRQLEELAMEEVKNVACPRHEITSSDLEHPSSTAVPVLPTTP